MHACKLMSLVKGARKSEAADQEHVRRALEIHHLKRAETIQVPARTLTDVLASHGITRIDFFSLDVEGYELSVLQGLDFAKHRPTFLLVEATFRREIEEFLRPWYEPVAELSHHDLLFRLRPA
jgi:FkbM family methyltransferase